MTTQPIVFVLMRGETPTAVAHDLETALNAGLTDETREETEPREYRWNPANLVTTRQAGTGHSWSLTVLSPRTGRWSRTLHSVVEVRALPAVPSTPEA